MMWGKTNHSHSILELIIFLQYDRCCSVVLENNHFVQLNLPRHVLDKKKKRSLPSTDLQKINRTPVCNKVVLRVQQPRFSDAQPRYWPWIYLHGTSINGIQGQLSYIMSGWGTDHSWHSLLLLTLCPWLFCVQKLLFHIKGKAET